MEDNLKDRTRYGLCIILSLISILLLTTLVFAETENLGSIQDAIDAKGAHWTAGES